VRLWADSVNLQADFERLRVLEVTAINLTLRLIVSSLCPASKMGTSGQCPCRPALNDHIVTADAAVHDDHGDGDDEVF
jgi:hypothetical protein